jgi:undecaprenyl diphosphate synthase
MSVRNQIQTEKLPQHVAIIMDGNGRWAAQQKQMRTFGHEHGVRSVKSIIEEASQIGIRYLTLYVFSTENWARPKQEVCILMELLAQTIQVEIETLHQNNVQLKIIGDKSALPTHVLSKLDNAVQHLQDNTGLNLVLGLSYSSRWEIVNAVKQIGIKVQDGKLSPENINCSLIEQHLATAGMPDPELMIRTGGEQRISNFLLWQLAYAELYFTPVLWPDFRKKHLLEALLDYQQRERRFGKTRER